MGSLLVESADLPLLAGIFLQVVKASLVVDQVMPITNHPEIPDL